MRRRVTRRLIQIKLFDAKLTFLPNIKWNSEGFKNAADESLCMRTVSKQAKG